MVTNDDDVCPPEVIGNIAIRKDREMSKLLPCHMPHARCERQMEKAFV